MSDMKMSRRFAVIVDVDGTVADMGKGQPGRRGPFDWDRVGEDEPRLPIIHLVQRLRGPYTHILWVSGRDSVCRQATQLWLNKHCSACGESLFMRPEGDYRPDDIVKLEIYHQYIASDYNVLWVLDDRNKPVRMWRTLGLTTLQVADGDF